MKRSTKTIEKLTERYRISIRTLNDLRERGISAGFYKQSADVEGEVDGLMTYDRRVIELYEH